MLHLFKCSLRNTAARISNSRFWTDGQAVALNATRVPFEPDFSSQRPFMLVALTLTICNCHCCSFCFLVSSALSSREAHTCYHRHRQHSVILFLSIFVGFCTSFADGSWAFSIPDILNYFKQLCSCNSFLHLWHIKQGIQLRLDCSHWNKALTDSTVCRAVSVDNHFESHFSKVLAGFPDERGSGCPLQLLTVFCWTSVKVSACAFKYKSLSLVRGLQCPKNKVSTKQIIHYLHGEQGLSRDDR